MSINSYISKQFSDPEGFGGGLISQIMNRQNRSLYDATIRLLKLSESDKVLDIGCGNGFVLNLLADTYKAKFTGIDPSYSILKSANRRNRRFVSSSVMRFAHGDVSSLPFAEGIFSKAYTINTVYFWDDLNKAMTEIRRVLKRDGLFINALYTNKTLSRFSHTASGYKQFTSEQLIKAGENMGFAVKIEPISDGAAYCISYQKLD